METSNFVVEEHLNLLLMGLFWVIMTSAIAFSKGYYNFTKRPEKPSLVSLKHFLLAFAILLTVEIVIAPCLAMLWSYFSTGSFTNLNFDKTTKAWFNNIVIILTGIFVCLYMRSLSSEVTNQVWGREAFLSLRKFFWDISLGIITWFISFPIVLVVGQLVGILIFLKYHYSHVDQVAVKHLKSAESGALYVFTVVLIVFIVPIIEEILFRGFLLNFLKSSFTRGKAIAVSALIFSLFHFAFSQGIGNIELLSSLFILACYLGFIYERQQSLWAPIALHATFNGISVFMLSFQ